MIPEIAILVGVLSACGMLLFALAVMRRPPQNRSDVTPTVSVIIAARNEEGNIGECLTSITGLTYPQDKLEVIVVDDSSVDRTGEIIADFAAKHAFIRGAQAPEPTEGLPGKVNALIEGIERSKGEILMFTDADCNVPAEWVSRTVSYYSRPEVSIVAGFTSISGENLLSRIQAIDWLMLLSAASAAASLSFPVTAVGNNFSLTRKAYDRTGGFRNIPFNITEDLALFSAVTKIEGNAAIVPIDVDTAVSSQPCTSWSQLFRQRKRWFVGGKEMSLGRSLAFGLAWLNTLVAATGWFYLDPVLWTALVILKIMGDILLALPAIGELGRQELLWAWIPFELYFVGYVLLMPLIAVFSPEVVWKERSFGGEKERALLQREKGS